MNKRHCAFGKWGLGVRSLSRMVLGLGPLWVETEKLGEDRCQTRVWQALDKDVLVILGTELNTLVEAGRRTWEVWLPGVAEWFFCVPKTATQGLCVMFSGGSGQSLRES